MSKGKVEIEPLEQAGNIKIIEKWRVISSKIHDVDGKLDQIEQEKQDLTIEHSTISQELTAISEAHEQDSLNYPQVSTLRKLRMEIDKYIQLAEQDEKQASDLEEWCAKRSAKNQEHLTTLQRKAYDLRKRAFINEDARTLPPVIKRKEIEISELEQKINDLVASSAMHSEVIDACSVLNDKLDSMKKYQTEAMEIEATVHTLRAQVDNLNEILQEKKTALQEHDVDLRTLGSSARDTARNLVTGVTEASNTLRQVKMSDIDTMKNIRDSIGDAKKYITEQEDFEIA